MKKQILIFFCLFCCLSATQAQRAQWMQEARWGVMTHYLFDWQARVGGFEMSVANLRKKVNAAQTSRSTEGNIHKASKLTAFDRGATEKAARLRT